MPAPHQVSIELRRLVSDVDDVPSAGYEDEAANRSVQSQDCGSENRAQPAVRYKKTRRRAHSYNWRWLCMPRLPWSGASQPPPFFSIDEKIPLIVAIVMGFQHAISMIGGVVTPPLLVSGPFNARLTTEESQYLLAVSLIMSGILSAVQIYQLKLWNGYVLGTGLISVVGTSFTFLPIAQSSILYMMQEDSPRYCGSDLDCSPAWSGQSGSLIGKSIPGVTNRGQCNPSTNRCRYSGQEAYGAFIGTCMLCSFLEIGLSFLPRRILRRLFPPTVTGVCVLLIGIGLTGTGMKYWGGGVFCSDHAPQRKVVTVGRDIPGDITSKYPSASPCRNGACTAPGGFLRGICRYQPPVYDSDANLTRGDRTECGAFADMPGVPPAAGDPGRSWVMCGGNGGVTLPYGSPEYIGLGFSVFVMLVVVEGFGCLVAYFAEHTPAGGGGGAPSAAGYVTWDKVRAAPWVTVPWAYTFPLSLYAPAAAPLLLCFVITTIETVGDITASAEASRVPSRGPSFDARLQGGLLADGLNSLLACVGTSMPNTTYSQNNGVIALTRCANRRAGFACCAWLAALGAASKLTAAAASIPDCVLGGMTTFLFANIVVSGVRILASAPPTRRSRFIAAAALGVGVGVAVVPAWATNALWPPPPPAAAAPSGGGGGGGGGEALLRDSLVIVLATPYCVGTLLALFLHLLLPLDLDD